MKERQWKLGDDLTETDNILDAIMFEELITTVRCNCKDISEKNVKETMNEILRFRTDDMKELLSRNMAEIMERVIGDKPLKMSFYDGTLNREVARRRIEATDKQIIYTYGFEYRSPSTHRKPISKREALVLLTEKSLLDVTEEDDCIHLNAYSDNDMW